MVVKRGKSKEETRPQGKARENFGFFAFHWSQNYKVFLLHSLRGADLVYQFSSSISMRIQCIITTSQNKTTPSRTPEIVLSMTKGCDYNSDVVPGVCRVLEQKRLA